MAIGVQAPAMPRRGLIGTRRFGTGHRREPFPPMYGYGRACLATHADHRKGQTCRSKGDNPNPTSSKAIGPRDPADVPHRASRGGAVPILTTAHGATRRPGVVALSRCPHFFVLRGLYRNTKTASLSHRGPFRLFRPHASRGPRRLWSRWPLRATRASVSWHASASHYSSAVRACLGPYRARAPP